MHIQEAGRRSDSLLRNKNPKLIATLGVVSRQACQRKNLAYAATYQLWSFSGGWHSCCAHVLNQLQHWPSANREEYQEILRALSPLRRNGCSPSTETDLFASSNEKLDKSILSRPLWLRCKPKGRIYQLVLSFFRRQPERSDVETRHKARNLPKFTFKPASCPLSYKGNLYDASVGAIVKCVALNSSLPDGCTSFNPLHRRSPEKCAYRFSVQFSMPQWEKLSQFWERSRKSLRDFKTLQYFRMPHIPPAKKKKKKKTRSIFDLVNDNWEWQFDLHFSSIKKGFSLFFILNYHIFLVATLIFVKVLTTLRPSYVETAYSSSYSASKRNNTDDFLKWRCEPSRHEYQASWVHTVEPHSFISSPWRATRITRVPGGLHSLLRKS